jgi:hypothetical protein
VRIELLELHPGVLLAGRRAGGLHAHHADGDDLQEALQGRDQTPRLQTRRRRALGAGAGSHCNRHHAGEPLASPLARDFHESIEAGEVQTPRRAVAATGAGRTNSHLNLHAGRRILRYPAERGG